MPLFMLYVCEEQSSLCEDNNAGLCARRGGWVKTQLVGTDETDAEVRIIIRVLTIITISIIVLIILSAQTPFWIKLRRVMSRRLSRGQSKIHNSWELTPL